MNSVSMEIMVRLALAKRKTIKLGTIRLTGVPGVKTAQVSREGRPDGRLIVGYSYEDGSPGGHVSCLIYVDPKDPKAGIRSMQVRASDSASTKRVRAARRRQTRREAAPAEIRVRHGWNDTYAGSDDYITWKRLPSGLYRMKCDCGRWRTAPRKLVWAVSRCTTCQAEHRRHRDR